MQKQNKTKTKTKKQKNVCHACTTFHPSLAQNEQHNYKTSALQESQRVWTRRMIPQPGLVSRAMQSHVTRAAGPLLLGEHKTAQFSFCRLLASKNNQICCR